VWLICAPSFHLSFLGERQALVLLPFRGSPWMLC
jgi:hypothetical protein